MKVRDQDIKRQRRRIWFMLALVILVFMIALTLGRYTLSWQDWTSLLSNILPGQRETLSQQTLLVLGKIRLPRLLANLLVGSALSVSGAIFQALFDNPMASPNVLGVNQGAAFGAALAILGMASQKLVILSSFTFGLLGVLLTYHIAKHLRLRHLLGLILAGMVISAIFQAGVSYIKLVADEENVLPAITYWLLGSFHSIHWNQLRPMFLPFGVGFGLAFAHRKDLNLLTLGDDKAQSLGLAVQRTRLLLIIAATLLTASSVAITGMIGWVGLLVPHACRLVIGSDYRYLLPSSALAGSLLLLLVDTLARTWTMTEIPIGILTALIGGPGFLYLLLRGGMERGLNR